MKLLESELIKMVERSERSYGGKPRKLGAIITLDVNVRPKNGVFLSQRLDWYIKELRGVYEEII